MLIVSLVLALLGIGIGVGTFFVVTETTWTDVTDDIGSCTYSFEGYDIKTVKINNTYGNVTFVEGSTWAVDFCNAYIPMVEVSCDGSELTVSMNTPVDITVCDWNIGVMPDFDLDRTPGVIVTFPADAVINSIDIQSAVGNIDFSTIHTGYIVAQTAFGRIDASKACVNYSGAMQSIIGKILTGDNFVIDTSYKFRLW